MKIIHVLRTFVCICSFHIFFFFFVISFCTGVLFYRSFGFGMKKTRNKKCHQMMQTHLIPLAKEQKYSVYLLFVICHWFWKVLFGQELNEKSLKHYKNRSINTHIFFFRLKVYSIFIHVSLLCFSSFFSTPALNSYKINSHGLVISILPIVDSIVPFFLSLDSWLLFFRVKRTEKRKMMKKNKFILFWSGFIFSLCMSLFRVENRVLTIVKAIYTTVNIDFSCRFDGGSLHCMQRWELKWI